MTVVLDTSPLNYLILIGTENILSQLFDEVYIPTAVQEELLHAGAPTSVYNWMVAKPEWLRIVRPETRPIVTLERLDPGEREAILLASEFQTDLLVLDEIIARRIALQNGLKVTGTLGLLSEAGRRGLIRIPEVVSRLRQTTFRAAPSLYKWLLDQHK